MAMVFALGVSWRKISSRFGDEAHASDVAARPVQAGDKTVFDRVVSGHEQNRDRCGRSLGCKCCKHVGDDDIHGPANQFVYQAWKPVNLIVGIEKFDRDILALAEMSALGQKRTHAVQQSKSALPPIATANADSRKTSCTLYAC